MLLNTHTISYCWYKRISLLFIFSFFFHSIIYSQPDLALDEAKIRQTMELDTEFINNNNTNNCYINEGCISGTGTRILLRFTTKISNVGNQDFYVGPPPPSPSQENETWEWDECHRHWHYEGYARYLLFDQEGNQTPIGFKNGFCLIDIECTSGSFTYNCNNQGISAGCADVYSKNLACQWVDLTDVPSGTYQLVVEVNWDRSPDANGRMERSFSNNSGNVCFEYVNETGSVPTITVLSDNRCDSAGCDDADNDGVCDEEDCQPNNPNRPTAPNTACNDNNPDTFNDRIQSDGCTCQGQPNNGGGDCDDIKVTGGDGSLRIEGFDSFAHYNVKVFTPQWSELDNCLDNCTDPSNFNNLPPGTYHVLVKTYNARWQIQCDENLDVTVRAGSCDDDDNDGVCNEDDCRPTNPNRPTTPGTSCNDGNSNTVNDVILADGCTCRGTPDTGCDDDDNDGVCNEDDCQPNNANRPTTPGTSCNDGNSNTINDEIQADGCTCQGTPDTGGACSDIEIRGTNNSIKISGFGSFPHHNLQIFTSTWAPTASCVDNCNEPYELRNLAAGNYFVSLKTFNSNWSVTECDIFQEITVGGAPCDDDDNDGVCNEDDCQPNNANRPTTPGTSCNDGNSNTINDQIQADGCICRGVPDTGCDDDDNDGVCNEDDCQPNNANRPTTPGTPCDDGDSNTMNDVIQSDGCACEGVRDTGGGCNITVSASNGQIRVTGLNGAHTSLKVYDPSWRLVYECNDNCDNPHIVTGLSAGTHYYDAKNFSSTWQLDCREDDYINVSAGRSLGTQDLRNLGGMVISPNPANTTVNIRLSLNERIEADLIFRDSYGRILYQKSIQSLGKLEIDIPVEDFPTGIYLVSMETDAGVLMSKRVAVVR